MLTLATSSMARVSARAVHISRLSRRFRLTALLTGVHFFQNRNNCSVSGLLQCLPYFVVCVWYFRRFRATRQRRFLEGSREVGVPKSTHWRVYVLPLYNEARRKSYTRISDICFEALLAAISKRFSFVFRKKKGTRGMLMRIQMVIGLY